MELWDIYDENRQPKGYTRVRGPLEPGDFHIIVNVWIRNSRGEYLITKRTPNKKWGNYWECTGGSAVTGDDSLTTALKEVKEEAGITLDPGNGKMIYTYNRLESHGNPDFCDVWLFTQDFDINEVVFQEGETCDAMWVRPGTIRRMITEGEFVPMIDYIEMVFDHK